jgi:hypothetical protein
LQEINPADCHLAFNLAKNIDDIEHCIELCVAKRNKAKVLSADIKMEFKYKDLFDIVLV